MKILFAALVFILFLKAENMEISVIVNGKSLSAVLEDNPTTREFVARLPLKLEMSELNQNEKYHHFSTPFSSEPKMINEIKSGDLMLYQDDYVVIFYKNFRQSSYRYTRMGKIIDSDALEELLGESSVVVEFVKAR